MSITQFNQQAAMHQMQLMERARLSQGGGMPITQFNQQAAMQQMQLLDRGQIQDIGPNQNNMSRGQLRNEWEGALSCRNPQGARPNGADFQAASGGAPFIKDFSSDSARSLLSEAAGAIAQSGLPGSQELAQSLAQGASDPKSVNQGAIKKLQSFLQSHGCPVGEAGTDGKLGPDTHKALMKFMGKKPANQESGGPSNIPPGFTYVGRQDPTTGRFIPAGMDQMSRMQNQQNPAAAHAYWA